MSALVLLLAIGASATGTREYRFDVYLDDAKIGSQTFHVADRGAERVVEIQADFAVKFFFITVYTYHHENVEVWENNCLRSMTSSTDDNGEDFLVRGVATGDTFEVTRTSGAESLSGCVSSFAYWDQDFLERPRLLNSQTGEYTTIEVAELGEDPVSFDGRDVPARCYLLTAENIKIKLWYADDKEWLALESLTSGGRALRYVRTNAPPIKTFGNGES
jgi:hypothetical protein